MNNEATNQRRAEMPESGPTATPPQKGASRNMQLARQTLTSLGPIMSTIAIGATFGYSAVLLPQLKAHPVNTTSAITWVENLNPLETDQERISLNNVEEESWVAASSVILMAPGCWISGILMERLGRRPSQLLIGPMYVGAWLTIGFAPNIGALIAGRMFSGLCIGLQSPLGPVYVAETSEPRLRGLLLAGISLAITVGILISHVLGTWLSWRVAAHLLGIFPALCLLSAIFSPESPSWLMKKNRAAEAAEAWRYLRGNEAEAEFRALESDATASPSISPDEARPRWKSSGFLKPLLILNVFFFTTQFSGVNVVAFYCIQMIAELSGESGPRSAHYATLILDVIRMAAALVACWLTRRYPRRILVIISGAGSALSLLSLSGGLVLGLEKQWLPATLLLAYTCAVTIGLVPLSWLLCGEIFPVALRGLGTGLSSGFASLCFFVVVKTGPAMIVGLGTAGTFLFYGSVTAAGTIFLYFFLPETKDKTLEEIEEKFNPKRKDGGDKETKKESTRL